MKCPDAAILEEYAERASGVATRPDLTEHVAVCPECRAALDEMEANRRMLSSVRRWGRSVDAAVPPSSIADFRVIREIGRGGMGIVYLAEQERPHRQVAIKVLHGRFDTARRRRFELEAELLGTLDHPAIAHVYSAGVAVGAGGEDLPYIAMEYVSGVPLDAYVAQRRFDARARLSLVATIADAVHHAHVNGVVHRDLKPANILVSRGEGIDRPRIVDFGIARATGADAGATTSTLVGQLLGTLPYMSPEQVAGDPRLVDARCDVYALGVIAFELLTGRLPHDLADCSFAEAARRIRDDDPARLVACDRAYRGDVDAIVARALEREPARRYASAGELAADIRRWSRDEPIVARAPGFADLWRRMRRRHRATVAATITGVAALAIGLGATAWYAHNAGVARRDAERRLHDALQNAEYLRSGVASRLGYVGGARPVVRQIVESVCTYYERLAVDHGDDPAVRAGLARSLASFGATLRQIGDRERGDEMMMRSHGIIADLYQKSPAEMTYRYDMDASLARMCSLSLARHDYAEAEAFARAGVEVCRQPVAESAFVVARSRSQAHRVLGDVLRVTWRTEEARAAFETALAFLPPLEGSFDGPMPLTLQDVACVRDRCRVLRGLIRVAPADDTRPAEMRAEWTRLADALLAARPDDPTAHHEVFQAHSAVAWACEREGATDVAIHHAERALGAADRLTTDDPAHEAFRLKAVAAEYRVARLRGGEGRLETAARELLDVTEAALVPDRRPSALTTHGEWLMKIKPEHLRDPAVARELFVEAMESGGPNGGRAYWNVAIAHEACGDREAAITMFELAHESLPVAAPLRASAAERLARLNSNPAK